MSHGFAVNDEVCLKDYPECVGTILEISEFPCITGQHLVLVRWYKTGLENREQLSSLIHFSLQRSKNYCNHDYVRYTGITESYWFCTKCDEKKELNDDIRTGNTC